MTKRNASLILICAVAIAVALFVPSSAFRAIAAILVVILALVFVIYSYRTSDPASHPEDPNLSQDNSQADSFAFSKLFEATMSGMREGLLVVDKDMRVVASNPAAHRLFNLSRGNLTEQRLTELTRNPAIYGAFLDALKGIERSGVKVQTHGPDRLIFDLRVVPLSSTDDNGEQRPARGALGVFVDVTRLERLEQVRQEFLSNVSHELRTPLTAILAFVETLEAGAIDDQEAARRFLPIIRKNALRMHDLIDDILELSAIEAGNVQVKGESLKLQPVVDDVVSSLASKAEAMEVVVTNDVPGDVRVYADRRRLEQMLTNLVDNAIKFNRKGGTVSIKCDQSPDRSRDRLVVEDTGEGIPAHHLERLFERFYRVDRARSRERGGTGLGLAIVKHLALLHEGEISVSSEVGKGSVFTIQLPSQFQK
ncbi:MAG TPA: ATP-binding protein [Pyrinomonadaceae bacterium]|nr:ATP-binding protein [Pyrinomonadaceae bacterium]